MRMPQPRTTFGRAVLPVLGGIGVFALLGLVTWIAALLVSRNPERVSDRLAPSEFEVGSLEFVAGEIAADGPIIFHDLARPDGLRSIVLDHTGDDIEEDWVVRYAYPEDRSPDCKIEQVRGTRRFTDCEQRTLEIDDLAPPPGVYPVVDRGDKTISINLQEATGGVQSPTTAP